MEIRLSNRALIPSLIAHLASRPSAVVSGLGEEALEVSLLGSYHPAMMRTILVLRVEEWQEARAVSGEDVTVTIV